MEDPTETSVGQQLQDDLIAFLQQWPWEWFVSLTFRQDVHPEAADKQLLFAGVSGLRPRHCAALWYKHAGFARIEPIRDTVAVLRYVSKDVPWGGELEFEPRMRTPQP